MLVSCLITILISHLLLFMYTDDSSNDISDSAVEFASITIDPDSAKNYLTTRKIDEQYEDTLNDLNTYVTNIDNVISISLVSFSVSVGHVIYDTDNNKIGTKIDYDDYTSTVKNDLIEGRKSWSVVEDRLLYTYHPIRTIDDKIAGYLIIRTTQKQSYNYAAMLIIGTGIILFMSLLFSKISMTFFDKEIFDPIDNFSKTALDFTGSVSSGGNIKTIELFKTSKDNEIGYLGNAINKMILDINDSTENLSNAIFEASHDGMTQLFNKRHYNNISANFRKCSSICVIYFDVNNLKMMNDTLGHEHGDYVIKKAAEYIRNLNVFIENSQHDTGTAANGGFSFRMGGDEFLFVISECSFKLIDMIIEKIETDSPVILSMEEDHIKCALSYGYSYAKGIYSYDTLLAEAEDNMYKNKNKLKKALHMPDR